jgi:septal ring factor EnvC (AmiA/AmiB activator)
MALYLTLNIFDCKRHQCFPEVDSKWSRADLIRVLHLSGFQKEFPDHVTYSSIIAALLDRLNVQKPIIYALDTGTNILLNSQTVSVVHNTLEIGPYALLHRFSEEATCDDVWKVFSEYARVEGKIYVINQETPESLRKKEEKIVVLQERVKKLEQELTNSETGRLTKQFREASLMLRKLEGELVEEKKKMATIENKNYDMVKNVMKLEAETKRYNDKLDVLRQKLGVNWEQTIDEIHETRQALLNCRRGTK